MNNIFIKRCLSYNLEEIKKIVKLGFEELGGFNNFIKPGEKILLKPNSLQPSKPEAAIITHPIFIKAIIQILKEKTDKIYIGESPGVGSFSVSASVSGLKKVIEEENIKLIEFVADTEIELKDKLVFGKFLIDKRLLEMDKIINLPKLKTHVLMQMSLCVKNMYGIIPGLKKLDYHARANQDRIQFAKILVDIYRAMPPHFNIVDGILAMEGEGPGTSGIPVNLGLIIMGENGFAIDRAIPEFIDVDPYRIYTNRIYKEYINNNKDIEYKIKGDNPGILKRFVMPPDEQKRGLFGFLVKILRSWTLSKPIFIKERCTGCQVCVKHCPVNALIYKGKNNGIICDYNKCIRCFCCHELCPEKAISIKKPLFSIFNK